MASGKDLTVTFEIRDMVSLKLLLIMLNMLCCEMEQEGNRRAPALRAMLTRFETTTHGDDEPMDLIG